MSVRSSVGAGWNSAWNGIGRLLGFLTWSLGIMTWVIAIMAVTTYGHEIIIRDECITTGKIETINKDYNIECNVTPTNQEEEK